MNITDRTADNTGSVNLLTETLSDGSTATVQPLDDHSSVISRSIDGECVWGQVWSAGHGHAAEHADQVADVLAEMRDRPSDFIRWWNAGTDLRVTS